jgi:hypothetical protein
LWFSTETDRLHLAQTKNLICVLQTLSKLIARWRNGICSGRRYRRHHDKKGDRNRASLGAARLFLRIIRHGTFFGFARFLTGELIGNGTAGRKEALEVLAKIITAEAKRVLGTYKSGRN